MFHLLQGEKGHLLLTFQHHSCSVNYIYPHLNKRIETQMICFCFFFGGGGGIQVIKRSIATIFFGDARKVERQSKKPMQESLLQRAQR